MKQIPYGVTDFIAIQKENKYFIDKTKYIPELEKSGNFLTFLRPRRFGKTLLLAVLDAYYNSLYKDIFDEIFGDTFIATHKTKEASSYAVLKFNFSDVSILDNVEDSFKHSLYIKTSNFIEMYNIPIKINENPNENLKNILGYFEKYSDKKLYILIDEYDHFANRLLIQNKSKYSKTITAKSSPYKEFFTILKGGASGNNAPIKRMFITGVTPMTMYDVTSGFNIGENISLNKNLNNLTSIDEDELEKLLKYYEIPSSYKALLKEWYNNYQFSPNVDYKVYNTDMVLYFIKQFKKENQAPKELIDINVRSDYSSLRELIYTNKKLNGNFETLQLLLSKNKIEVENLVQDFSALNLVDANNFKSLLFYLGLITIKEQKLNLTLNIPNETIKRIDIDYINSSLHLEDIFSIRADRLGEKLSDFAQYGDLEVFNFLAKEIKEASSLRDYIKGEHHIKAMYLTYLSLTNYFVVKTEAELNKGFADLFIKPLNPFVDYFALVELKYINRSEKNYKEKIPQLIKQAKEQLNTYEKDEMVQEFVKDGKKLVKIVMVFYGWELLEIVI
jgi:hypothetical protein